MKHEKLIASLKQIEKLVADCLEAASESPSSSVSKTAKAQPVAKVRSALESANFTLPFRPFIKKHARGMSGREKFTLVLAHITKGNVKAETKLETITKAWNSMKGTLGDFNLAHTTRAKDKGWVDSPKTGVYVLLPGWTEILSDNA